MVPSCRIPRFCVGERSDISGRVESLGPSVGHSGRTEACRSRPQFPTRYLWLGVYEIRDAQRRAKFAACQCNNIWSFYVPASPGTPGSFEAKTVKHEGYWPTSKDKAIKSPWPIPDPAWLGRTAFLSRLDKLEATAERVYYMGKSLCRLCGCQNGNQEFRFDDWVWPEGYRHYIADHYVRPSEQFEDFIETAVGSPDDLLAD